MKNCVLSIVVLLASPAFSQILDVQNASNFTCSGSTCQVILSTQSHTAGGNMIAVWAFWQSSSGYTVNLVQDSNLLNSFVSAVGPTVQSASSTPITAQIFYAKNIHASATHDVITVTFTGSVSSAGAVAVEYSGLDQSYPLDSTSAGYSYSPGAALDSGTVAPANANLLVFGGGTTDATGMAFLGVGTGFTSVVANAKSIAEELITTSPNNSLRRANATANTSVNWVMQMAVFRDTSWTVGGGWSPVRPYQVLDATQFPGTDPCAQTKTAIETPISGNSSPVVDSRGFISAVIPCAAAPFGSTDTGVLYLPNGTIQQQNTGTNVWTLGSGLELIGGGRGVAGQQTFIQAQNNASGSTTAQPILQLGTSTSGPIFGTELREFSLDGNNKTGSIGIEDDYCQEQCEIDHLKITGTQVTGADFGNGGNFIQHGINFHNFELNTGGGGDTTSCGPYPSSAPTVSNLSVSGTIATVTVSSTTGMFSRGQAYFSGLTGTNANYYNSNGWDVTVTNATQFTFPVKSGAPNLGSTGGNVQEYDIPLRVWTGSGTAVRDISNGTISASQCTHTLPLTVIGVEVSGGTPVTLAQLHVEAYPTGLDIGGLAITSNVNIEGNDLEGGSSTAGNFVITGVQINNSFGTPTNIRIHNLTTKGSGSTNPTNSLVDLANGNTLSFANNPRIELYELDGSGFPHALIADCGEMFKGWCDDGISNSLYSSHIKLMSISDSTGLVTVPIVQALNLPTCNANSESAHMVVNNCSAACSAGGACLSPGTTHCELYCNSSSWLETGR